MRVTVDLRPPWPVAWVSAPSRAFLRRVDSAWLLLAGEQLSLMSPVAIHGLPMFAAHNHRWLSLHSQKLTTTGPPVAFYAPCVVE